MKYLGILLATLISFSGQAAEPSGKQAEALQAIQSFGKELKGTLKNALETSPSHAVQVCHSQAPKIAASHSSKDRILGRVSSKARNPQQKPKAWMKKTIQAYESGSLKEPYQVVRIDEHRSGLLKPIKTEAICLVCHGKSLAPEISQTLKTLYPNDQATGYDLGEIRGYFYAEYKD